MTGLLLLLYISMPFLIFGLVIWLTTRENRQEKDSKSHGIRTHRLIVTLAAYTLSLGGIFGGVFFASIGMRSNQIISISITTTALIALISNAIMALAWIYNAKINKLLPYVFTISSLGYLIVHFPFSVHNITEALATYFVFVILSTLSILILGYYLTYISLKNET